MNPLAVDQQFFTALIAADTKMLERILTVDFILIDVMSGAENTKQAFLAFVGAGQAKFDSIEPDEHFPVRFQRDNRLMFVAPAQSLLLRIVNVSHKK